MKTIICISFLLFGQYANAQGDVVIDSVSAPNSEYYTFPVELPEITEELPKFPGGQDAMMKFISDYLVYPEKAKKNDVQGEVKLKFVVVSTGHIKDIFVIGKERYGYGLEEEAIRVIRNMPRWTPGRQNRMPVNVQCTLSIIFKLK
jgi:protein TonB